jgi:hypothetical protein
MSCSPRMSARLVVFLRKFGKEVGWVGTDKRMRLRMRARGIGQHMAAQTFKTIHLSLLVV